MVLTWTIGSFLLGAIPFPVWIGKFALRKEIRQYGDKNPGATNVLRAGGPFWYVVALILEISKGALPLGLAYQIYGSQDWRIIPIAVAPTLGHAFSPFLAFKGGKGLAVSLGVWIGLTLWKVPVVALVSIVIASLLLHPHGWAVVVALMAVGLATVLWIGSPLLIAVWSLQAFLLAYTHRTDLSERPRIARRKTR